MVARPRDVAVAKSLAAEVRAAEGRRRTWRKVTTLLDLFGVYRLTPAVRERIGVALRAAGLVAEPPIEIVERYQTIRLESVDKAVPLERATGQKDDQPSDGAAIRSVTQWVPGHRPYEASLVGAASD